MEIDAENVVTIVTSPGNVTEHNRFSTASKRPRDSTEDSSTFRLRLKEFGQRAAALRDEVAAGADKPSEALQGKMWNLVLDLRPYVVGFASPNVAQLPGEVRELMLGNPQRVARYSVLTLRMYATVTRIVVAAPAILIHCILTLFSLFPILGIPSKTCAIGDILFKVLHHAFDVLYNCYQPLLLQLFKVIVQEEVIGAFVFTTVPGRRSGYGRCTIQVLRLPEVLGFKGDTRQLFRTTIVAESLYEVVSVAQCFCTVINMLLTGNFPLLPTWRERKSILRLACSLLSVNVAAGLSTSMYESWKETVGNGERRNGEEGVNLAFALHTTAASLLHAMLMSDLLVKELHAPMILYTLVQHVYEMSRAHVKKGWSKELALLRWLVDQKGERQCEVRQELFPPHVGKSFTQQNTGQTRKVGQRESPFCQSEWLTNSLFNTNMCDDTVSAITCCSTGQVDAEKREAALLLLALLKRALSCKQDLLPRFEETFYRIGENVLDALVTRRVTPESIYFHDMSVEASVVHQLLCFFPRDAVSSLLRKILQRRRAVMGNNDYLLAKANASAILCEEAATFRCVWKQLVTEYDSSILDAAIIILRFGCEKETMQSVVLDSLRDLTSGKVTVRIGDSPLRYSLLYAELVRRLPITDFSYTNNIARLIVEVINVRAGEQDVAMWRISGVLRGWREHVTRNYQQSGNDVTPSPLDGPLDTARVSATVIASQKLLDALGWSTSFAVSLAKSGATYGNDALLHFLNQLLGITTELFAIFERMRATQADYCEVEPSTDETATTGVEVVSSSSTNDDVVEVKPYDGEKPKAQCSELLNEHEVNPFVLKQPVAAVMELTGRTDTVVYDLACAVQQLVPDKCATNNGAVQDAFISLMCLCNVLLSARKSSSTDFVLAHAFGHRNEVIRLGYAALSLRVLLERSGNVDVAAVLKDTISKHSNADERTGPSLLLRQLETLRAAFTEEWEGFVQQGPRSGTLRDFSPSSLSLTTISSLRDHCNTKVCRDVINVCRAICELDGDMYATKATALEVAHGVMSRFSWSMDYLFSCDPDIIHTVFFRAMCYLLGKNVREVVMRGLDDILPRSLLADDGAEQLLRINELLGEPLSLMSKFPMIMAYILLCDAANGASERLDNVKKVLQFLSKRLSDLPDMVNRSLGSIIASLMYLHGGREVLSRDRGSLTEQKRVAVGNNIEAEKREDDVGGLSEFDLAVEMALCIGECGPSVTDIKLVLEMQVTNDTVDGGSLTKHVFSVLDTVSQCVGINNRVTAETVDVSVHTVQRWLYGLISLIRCLGSHTTVIASKLPAILDFCSFRPQLVRVVCSVWRELLSRCTPRYLSEHSPSIVVDLLSMEALTEPGDIEALLHLDEAMRVVYERSKSEPFWELYFKIMSRSNILIRRLRSNGSSAKCQTYESGNAPLSAKGSADVIVTGLFSVVQSSSTKCKKVFVRALYQYLSTTDVAGRMELTCAARQHPQLIPTLLNCVFELHDEYVQYVLACVGMIGAVGHSNGSMLRHGCQHTGSNNLSPVSLHLSGRVSSSTRKLLLSHPTEVLHWREFAVELLSVHCPRALANTADPTMHDRAAFAVQELLRVFANAERESKCYPTLQNDEALHIEELQRYSWWMELEPSCRQMIEGYTTTKYTACVLQRTELRSPVYVSGMEINTWLNVWFCDLVLRCRGVFGQMMKALRNMAKGEQTLISYLLPHMIIHIISKGDEEDTDAIVTEVNLLLEAASRTGVQESCKAASLHSQNLMMEVNTHMANVTSLEEHVQQIFNVLEGVEHLLFELRRTPRKSRTGHEGGIDNEKADLVVKVIRDFFERVPWTSKVEAAIGIGSSMRALRCLEGQRYLPKVQDVVGKGISLQRIFAALNDRDSSRSLHRMQDHNPEDAAFSHENNGEWVQALQACELVLQQRPQSINHQFTALRCMQQLGQLHLMSRYSQALLKDSPRPSTLQSATWCRQTQLAALQNYANEAAWRLGEWDSVQARQDLPVSLALPMVALNKMLKRRGTLHDVFAACLFQRMKIAPIIRAACRESYAQVYPHVVFLHALTDIESAAVAVATSMAQVSPDPSDPVVSFRATGLRDTKKMQELGPTLQRRASLTETTLDTQELLLSLHRSIFRAFSMEEEVSKTWMSHVKLLRNEGFLEPALSAVKQASLNNKFTSPSYWTTPAKLLYEMNMSKQAIEFAEDAASDESIPPEIRAKLRVLLTRWKQDISYQTPQEVVDSYELALVMHPSEKAHHHLALFYETVYHSVHSSLLQSSSDAAKSTRETFERKEVEAVETYVLLAIKHFGMALQLGCKTVLISLPRMLNLWLNCSSSLASSAAEAYPDSNIVAPSLQKMADMIERFLLVEETKLSPQLLITALPQLLSRIGHESKHVVNIITKTVVNLMKTFPQQCLWQVLPIDRSKQASRGEVARRGILEPYSRLSANEKKLVDNMIIVFKSLIDLCNCSVGELTNGNRSSEPSLAGRPFIQRMEKIFTTTKVLLPTTANLSPNVLHIPSKSGVFAGSATFQEFIPKVNIMSSLQKPKRITVVSSEGEPVSFLCKSRDEPRKDMRMMEIATLMNTFFLSDPEARRKRFALRRYAVSALNDDCAIIEWVNNLVPFRKGVEECYAIDGTGVCISNVRAWKAKVDSGIMKKLDMFERFIFPRAPPVFHIWFYSNFRSHQDWYHARTIYTQATALWSIAGHIVGLGDRHGENLMIDVRTGELMHVDFACMFDKGETLEVPERVRFRLTQNVVDGMGVLGVDGPFRACCQAALRCQMKNKTAVMSVVETLLHDPLVEWMREQSKRQRSFDPKQLIGRVSRRLDGFLDLYNPSKEKDTLALGCEGQVSRLISHSSAIENISEMYIWWMAWL
ncbi:phosphatidylinositol 3-related kinase, putative [Trypanosoma brucei gambiense DAL972]|uniref:non-specific serine/threonine protein kinase n=1 Tax=Trypanosoma brucei gambiense (strain MHOM/CI/86/DAL972) TaxID=679716 RepID=D0AA26_TRYB9|nr:phosphatidylinositol 3-related kinase, putative [Trypanosoma brucei gambiense DAL972]CBH18527.1 phosphatidylinositol 3-related kinase, putative [Trypanosoma brucei gambiense DAL972]|eukprot:XP_011780791.1 phosphatidylinositol 3-related kinase, putative [Trypanosoma brucei gambiense DAL972]